MRGGCARRIELRRPCRASSRIEKSPSTVTMAIHRPLGGAACVRWAMCRPPSSSLIALSAASSGLRRRRSAATVPTVPVLGASCRCPDGSGMKRSTKPEAVVEGWRLIATDDELKNTRAPVTVSSELIHSSYFSPVESARNLTRFGERKHHATYGECYLICRPTSVAHSRREPGDAMRQHLLRWRLDPGTFRSDLRCHACPLSCPAWAHACPSISRPPLWSMLSAHRWSLLAPTPVHARSYSTGCGTRSGPGTTAGGRSKPTSTGFAGTSRFIG